MSTEVVDDQTLAELERSGPALQRAVRPFAAEDRPRTWRLLLGTLALQGGAMTATLLAPLWLKPVGAALVGLLLVRLFIFVHDAEHGAIFRGSPTGRAVVWLLGVYTLNAPPVWREIHSRHHQTNAMPLATPLSAYRPGDMLSRAVSVPQWAAMTAWERTRYRIVRSPALIVFAWFTVFVLGSCIYPALRDPRRQWPGMVALVGFLGGGAALWLLAGSEAVFWILALPNFLGSMLGAYLFLAQHSFPDAVPAGTASRADLVTAAVASSSFFEMPGWMHWFTGNIGYHHVHHLNHRIPFYRLPEAAAALPATVRPGRTSFRPRDILAVLRCQVWDPAVGRMVSIREADEAVRR